MDYEQRQNIEKELVKNYPNLQNAFYNGKLSGEKLTNYVTQPFWHSLNHSKRSLDRKGARIDVECVGRISPPRLKTKATDEAVQVREYHQKVLERKKVYVNEQCVYKKKDRKLYNTSVIDIKTNENEVVCPSCGARGLASSFIDGCDFCNTKFVINKSVNKISSFASQENTRSKVVRVFVKLIVILAIIAFILGLATAASFVCAIVYDTAIGWYVKPELKTAVTRILLLGYYIFPEIIKFIFITLLVFGISGYFLIKLSVKRIDGEEHVNNLVREIIPENFAQNLEHKLRSIHYADSTREVSAFSTVDLSEVVGEYNNVLETSMNKLTFVDSGICSEGLFVDAEARLNNLILEDSQVKEETELVKVRMVARNDMKEQRFDSALSYKCEGCGGSIDLFEGGFCMHCGRAVDYGKYNWTIGGYKRLGKAPNTYKRMRLLFTGILTAVILILSGIFVASNRNTINMYINIKAAYEFAAGEFDDIKTMDEVCDNTKLMESKQFDIIRMNKYESDYVQNDVASYISYLWTLDFDEVEYPERGTKEYDNVIRLERRHYFDYMYLRSELETQVVIIEYNDNGNEINVIFDAE